MVNGQNGSVWIREKAFFSTSALNLPQRLKLVREKNLSKNFFLHKLYILKFISRTISVKLLFGSEIRENTNVWIIDNQRKKTPHNTFTIACKLKRPSLRKQLTTDYSIGDNVQISSCHCKTQVHSYTFYDYPLTKYQSTKECKSI